MCVIFKSSRSYHSVYFEIHCARVTLYFPIIMRNVATLSLEQLLRTAAGFKQVFLVPLFFVLACSTFLMDGRDGCCRWN